MCLLLRLLGLVLSRITRFFRPYGKKIYFGYDDITIPYFYIGDTPDQLAAMERVLVFGLNKECLSSH